MEKRPVEYISEQIGVSGRVKANCRSIYFKILTGTCTIDKEPLIINQPKIVNGYPGDYNIHTFNVVLGGGAILYVIREIELDPNIIKIPK